MKISRSRKFDLDKCLVLFIISAVGYFGGDTRTYLDFINTCDGVNLSKFNDKYGNTIQNVKKFYVPFFALNIIYLVLSCCSNIGSGVAGKKRRIEIKCVKGICSIARYFRIVD